MKKFFSLVLALVMALSLTTVAWGAGTTYYVSATGDDAAAGTDVAPLKTITAALGKSDVEKIVLLSDVTEATVAVTKDIIIDGGNHKLTATGYAIDIQAGVEVSLANLTIETVMYAVNMRGASDNAVVTIDNCDLTGCIALNVWGENVVVTATNTDFTSVDNSNAENYAAVVLNNNGSKSAENSVITVTGGSITAEDENGDPSSATSNGTLTGVIDISGCPSVVGSSKVVVAIITYPGSTNFYSYFSVADATEAALSRGETKIELLETIVNSGETFVPDSSITYVPPAGAELVDDGTGNMMVAPTGTSGGAVATKLYVADGNATNGWKLVSSFPGDDLDDFAKDASDDCLPCYQVGGTYYVEVKEAAATYKLVYGNKTVFLSPIAEKFVKYDAKASGLTVVDAEDAECGDWNVVNLDEDDVYYATYDKKTGAVTGAFVATKNGSVQLLVNGKIVDVEELTIGTDIEWMLHEWKGYDVVNYQYTTVKCAECGKVAKLYANATAATVGKVEPVKVVVDGTTLGWITAADFFGFGTVSAPSTDKTVTSADTFDAGIAMYVGMSVLAATGSAVVIGKKKD